MTVVGNQVKGDGMIAHVLLTIDRFVMIFLTTNFLIFYMIMNLT